jgi:hypothetical protein
MPTKSYMHVHALVPWDLMGGYHKNRMVSGFIGGQRVSMWSDACVLTKHKKCYVYLLSLICMSKPWSLGNMYPAKSCKDG